MRHVLHRFDYDEKDTKLVGRPDEKIVGWGVDLFEQDEDTARSRPSPLQPA